MKNFFVFTVIFALFFTLLFSEDYNHYFGNMHSHTSYSDGTADPETAYGYAKTKSALDILTITDHARDINLTSTGESEWKKTLETAHKFSDENFLGIRGFEWTITGPGHITVYDTEHFTPSMETSFSGIYKWLILNDGIGNFCHPKPRWGTFDDFAYYPMADKYMTMFEIVNTSAQMEPVYFENYIKALNKGWHIAPTANQDNHKSNWGTANRARTVFIMKNLDEKSLYESMRSMNLYASEDETAKIKFNGNNKHMGSVLYDLDEIELSLEYYDSGDFVDKIYLYSSHGMKLLNPEIYKDKDNFNFTIKKNIDRNYEWFFVRIVQKDQDDIVSAPVWVQNSDKKYVLSPVLLTENPSAGKSFTAGINLINMNFKIEKFDIIVKNGDGNILFSDEYSVEPYENKLIKITLEDETGKLFFFFEEKMAGELNVEFSSLIAKVDISHENNYSRLNTFIEKQVGIINGDFEKIRSINENSISDTDLLFVPCPDNNSFFPEYSVISDEQIQLISDLVNKGSLRTYILFESEKGTLNSSVESFNKLLLKIDSEFILKSDGKGIVRNEAYEGQNSSGLIVVKNFKDENAGEVLIKLMGD